MVVPDSARGELALARADARVVARYDDFSLVEATGDDVDRLRNAGAGRRDDMREVVLASGRVDPAQRPSLAAKDAPERSEALVLVQFVGPVKEEWLAKLRATGATVLGYAAQNGYIVHAAGDALVRVTELVGSYPAVRAATALRPADKVERGAAGGHVAVQTVAGAPGAEARTRAEHAGRKLAAGLSAAHVRTQFLDLSAAEVAELASDPAVVRARNRRHSPRSPPAHRPRQASRAHRAPRPSARRGRPVARHLVVGEPGHQDIGHPGKPLTCEVDNLRV